MISKKHRRTEVEEFDKGSVTQGDERECSEARREEN